MTDNTTATAELADVRPSEGEYFYTDAYGLQCYHGQSSYATCFVCGEKGTAHGYLHIHATAQCMAAGRRIAAMFKPEACYGLDTNACLKPAVSVIISACETHRHCAEILFHLTADGIITLEHVRRAEKALISRPEFNQLVAEAAQTIWNRNEQNRRCHDWYDAWDLFLKETSRIPSLAERKERAGRLWQERKETQATEDWLQAEKIISAFYTADAS